MYGHYLIPDQYGNQARQAQHHRVFLANKEPRKDALLPEMGITGSKPYDGKTAHIITLENGSLGAYQYKRLMQLGQCHADTVCIALNAGHGLCQESAVDI
jgi:hypothetical protein